MDLFTLTAKLGLDTSDYETKIADVVKSAREAGEEIDTALGGGTETAAAVGTAVSAAQTKTGTFGETLGAILASGVIQDFGSAVFDAGKKTIESASSLKEAQGLLAIAQKEMEQHVYDTAAIGTMIAQQLGVEFDGTAESFRSMMDSMAAYAVAESLGFSDADISDALSGYDSASEKAEEHRKRIAELQAEYDTVEAGVSESTAAMQSSVGALEGTVTESFDGIETATDGLLTGFDQSDTTYNNAYNTGIGAANGLSDAYGSFSAAANAYSLRASLIGGGVPSVLSAPKLAVGLDYVPYDEYPAQLHEGEAVLTKAEAADWRRGVDRAQGPTAAEIGHAVADAMRETLNGLGVYMGADRVAMSNVELFNALLAVASIVLTVYFGMRHK